MRGPRAVPRHRDERRHPKRDAALWFGIILSVLIHFAAFQWWPTMEADKIAVEARTLEALELPPEVEIPPRPTAIARPATPVIASADVSEDITIAPTTFEANPVSELPPPPSPSEEGGSIRDAPTFTPYTVSPRVLNRQAVQSLLMKEYPQLLKDAGIGGTATVWFFIDEEGRVLETRLRESSGHVKLDEAALRVAQSIRFSPALNRDKKVKVWVQFPVTFTVR